MSSRFSLFAAGRQRWLTATLIPLIAAAAFATPADVDDQSYLDYLRSHGVPAPYAPHSVGMGYRICAQIQAGMSPAATAARYGVVDRIWTSVIVYAAQHELCPKTLPAPVHPARPTPSCTDRIIEKRCSVEHLDTSVL